MTSPRIKFGYAGLSYARALAEARLVLLPNLRPLAQRTERLAALAEIIAETAPRQ